MDPYALKHAIAEIESELVNAGIDPSKFTDGELIDWAFRILLIAEMRQLNKNLEHLSAQVNRIR